MNTPTQEVTVPWHKVVGWLVVVGLATIAVNMAAKRAYDLWQTGK